jgi:glycosyltransferase involved in cell wall biosynthesis
MKKRLAIVSTHPIQYNAPWFRLLQERGEVISRVFYTWRTAGEIHDPGFGRTVSWDIPLSEGYEWEYAPPSRAVQQRTYRNMDSPSLLPRIKAFRPDAVLVIGWNYRSHFRVMRQIHGRIPILFRGDSTLLDKRPLAREWLRTKLLRWVFKHIDVALSVGTNNTNYFLHHGLRQDAIVLAPHAIDNDRFAEPDAEYRANSDQIRAELKVRTDKTIVLFVGKLIAEKATDILVDGYHSIAERRKDIKLLLVGSGPLENQLQQTLCEKTPIQLMPFQNQTRMPVIYRTGDITILPSRSETWGLCLNESMASGRAVIASDRCGATIDLVRESETGYSCKATVEDVARILLNLPDRMTLLRMGKTCQSFIQSWSFDNIADMLSLTMHRLTSGRG